MTKKNETALIKVEGGKNAQEQTPATIAETTNPATNQEQPENVEQLKQQVEQLQKRLAAIPQNLDDRIKYFNEKREMIRRLSILTANIEALDTHAAKLQELAAVNDFESEDYTLTIESGNRYSKTAALTLKNPLIIGDVIAYMMGRIDSKRLELAAQIEA